MQKWKRNWLITSKLIWGIWRILTRALKNLKNFHFNGLTLTKVYYNTWAKKVQRSSMALNNDSKFVGKLTCAFKNDMSNLENIQSTRKYQNWDFFYPKYKIYELKIYRGVMCHENEEWCKIGRGIDLSFQNWCGEFHKFWPEHLKV